MMIFMQVRPYPVTALDWGASPQHLLLRISLFNLFCLAVSQEPAPWNGQGDTNKAMSLCPGLMTPHDNPCIQFEYMSVQVDD